MKEKAGVVVRVLGLLLAGALFNPSYAIPIGGVEFPSGLSSFADRVVSLMPGPNTTNIDATKALGAPDIPSTQNAVSLGFEGVLILEFTDNFLVDQTVVEAVPPLPQ